MTEEWRNIKGFEGLYQVSNLGRVKSLKDNYGNYREKILKTINRGDGYLFVNLYLNNKCKKYDIHRLVAKAFIPNPDNLHEVNHIDENKENNCVDNLEWCDHRYNIRYSKSIKIGCFKNGKLIKIYEAIRDVNNDGFNHGHVIQCCKGKQKTHHGFTWRYI